MAYIVQYVCNMCKFSRTENGVRNPGGGALGPNMYGCVPLRCCDSYPVWEHFPQFRYPRLGAKLQKATLCLGAKDQENTLKSCLGGEQKFEKSIPFWEHFCRRRYPAREQEW